MTDVAGEGGKAIDGLPGVAIVGAAADAIAVVHVAVVIDVEGVVDKERRRSLGPELPVDGGADGGPGRPTPASREGGAARYSYVLLGGIGVLVLDGHDEAAVDGAADDGGIDGAEGLVEEETGG